LTRTVNNTGGATITTSYAAWDAHGRPTAGTISPGGPIKIVYDDAARTATTHRSFGTETQTYDENGNTVRIVQRYGSQVVTTTTKINATARICKPA
jgi:YD repeat-containing protein